MARTEITFAPTSRRLASAPSPSRAREDRALVDHVAEIIARPKAGPADSFVLHAPLELMARAALLPRVPEASREAARARIVALGDAYLAAGAPAEARPPRAFGAIDVALARLRAAIDAGDVDEADDVAAYVADAAPAGVIVRGLAADVVPRLSAAGHGCIFLALLGRPTSGPMVAYALRGLARELARAPDWTLTWQRRRAPSVAPSMDLAARLRRPRAPGEPGSAFIHPIMSLVERTGLAESTLDAATRGLGVHAARRVLSRVAALSMLQDDLAQAPYGWSHCLTMPQATLAIAPLCPSPEDAIAVAATFVLGFRATLGRVVLDLDHVPDARAGSTLDALDDAPAVAASAAFHAAPHAIGDVIDRLVTRAALHEDAHLAKYTLACLDARAYDRGAARLYLAAAAYLGAYWEDRARRGLGAPSIA